MTIEVRQMVIKSEVQEAGEDAEKKTDKKDAGGCDDCGGDGQQDAARERSQLRDTASMLARLKER